MTLPDGGESELRSDLPGRRVGHTLADTEPHPAWSTPPAASGCACSPPANAYGFTSTCSIVLTTGHHPADNYVSIGTLSKYDLAAETAKGFGPGANAIDNTLGLGNDIGEVAVNGPSFATSVA